MKVSSPISSEALRVRCPYLPQVYPADLNAASIQAFKKVRDAAFYHTLLSYAQKRWMEGMPAQALLMINRALSCHLPKQDLDEAERSPYRAVAWMLQQREAGGFIGNPRRHYQHLATRMVEPHKPLRVARAWACWHLAKLVLPDQEFPPDVRQIWEEHLVEPSYAEIESQLSAQSPSNDVQAWKRVVQSLEPGSKPTSSPNGSWKAVPVNASEELAKITSLAHQIWPECYRDILTAEQIEYMLKEGYSQEKLLHQFQEPGMEFGLTKPDDSSPEDGFYAFQIFSDSENAFLHKLYLSQQARGSGRGKETLQTLESRFRALKLRSMKLRVNKNNYRAITAYTRFGMRITEAITSDIGNGFVMDDYVLEKTW